MLLIKCHKCAPPHERVTFIKLKRAFHEKVCAVKRVRREIITQSPGFNSETGEINYHILFSLDSVASLTGRITCDVFLSVAI